MNIQNTTPPPLPRNRPALVWVISIFYVTSAGFTLLSFALVFSGLIPLNEAQRTYFQSQTIFDYGSMLLIGLTNFTGAVLLFLLRKLALLCFMSAFALGVLLTAYQIVAKNWLGVIGGPGLVGALIGWGISIAIIAYTRKLTTQGLLQ